MHIADAHILDEAAHWLARHYASDFSEAERADLARWRSQSPQHEHVWQHAQQLQSRMGSIPGAVGMAVLNRSRTSGARRQLLRTAAWVVTTPALGWFAYQHMPWQDWTADYRTAKGERRAITLADGSHLQLNTASAVSIRIDREARRVRQHAGEIFIETSHAPEYATRPFIVQTVDGQMQALGTRFSVRKHEQSTTLSVLEGAVRVIPAAQATAVVVRAGEQLSFNSQGTSAAAPLASHADAWTLGVLYAENLRLREFLAEVGRYREGILRCDAGVADLRVSGTYQLRDTDNILSLLEQSLPIRVDRRTRYWVTIARR